MHGGGKIFLHSLKRRPADASRDAFGGQVDAAWPANAFPPPHASLLKAQGEKKKKKENRASLKIIFSLFFRKYKSKIKQCKRVIRDLENHSLGPLCSYTLYFTWHEMAKHSVVRIVSHIHCFAWIILL